MRGLRSYSDQFEPVLLGFLCAAATALLIMGDVAWRADQLWYDLSLRLHSSNAPDDVMIVAIDEGSLEQLGRWPWSRDRHAQLIDVLRQEGARAIAMDIIFAEPEANHLEHDVALAQAIRAAGNVVLPVVIEQSTAHEQLVETLPLPSMAQAAAGLGHVHVELDPDGIARSVYLYEGLGTPQWPSLALDLLRVAHGDAVSNAQNNLVPSGASPYALRRAMRVLIPFLGPPGHFMQISFARVLNGDYPKGAFKDKTILVGATATGLGDALPTPTSGWARAMPGVEINANLFSALRDDRLIRPLTAGISVLLGAVLAFIAPLWFRRIDPRWVAPAALGLLLLPLVLSVLLLWGAAVWFPPVAASLVIATSYPLWSWRRLNFTMRYFDLALARLSHESGLALSRPRGQLDQTLEYFAALFALRAVVVVDCDGKSIAGWNPALVGTPPALVDDAGWIDHDHACWASVPRAAEIWRVGIVKNTGAPWAPNMGELIRDHLREWLDPVRDSEDYGTEVLTARVRQVEDATQRLAALRRFVADGFAQMAEGVAIVNSAGDLVYVNARATALVGSSDDKRVLQWLCALQPNEAQHWRNVVRDVLLHDRPATVESRAPGDRTVLLHFGSFRYQEQVRAGLIISLVDITELRESERKRQETLDFVSHDLRSPLVSTLSLVEMMRAERTGQSLDESLQTIEKLSRRTLELAEDFVQLARAQAVETESFVEIEWSAIVANAVAQVWPLAKSAEIELVTEANFDELWCRGDAGLLQRALVNLLHNAVKFSPRGSRVAVRSGALDGSLFTCVADQGPGISAADFEHLFDRFQRGAGEAAQRAGGVGLGLVLVKTVMARHGGRVEAHSAPGEGARFCLWLPQDSTAL